MNVYETITAQQGRPGTTVWCVGEQLKGMIAGNPALEEILAQDLAQASMSLIHAEAQIKAFADQRHKETGGTCVGVSPWEAEDVLREFYGLPERGAPAVPTAAPPQPEQPGDLIDLDEFL